MDANQFEIAVAETLKENGYNTNKTKATSDRGVDVIAIKDGEKFAVQCKFYSSNNKVSSPEVQQVSGLLSNPQFDHAVIITTSSFTDEARQIAANRGVELVQSDIRIELPELGKSSTTRSANALDLSNLTKKETEVSDIIKSHIDRVSEEIPHSLTIELENGKYTIYGHVHDIEHKNREKILQIAKTADKYNWKHRETVSGAGGGSISSILPRVRFASDNFDMVSEQRSAKIMSLICESAFNIEVSASIINEQEGRPFGWAINPGSNDKRIVGE